VADGAAIALDDLRAGVAAGIVTEAQAATLADLAARRRGALGALAEDDEPFELFRGFNEVFTALGVALFGLGLGAASALAFVGLTGPLLVATAASWLLAEFLTRRKRMVLPSLLLALGFSGAVAGLAGMQALGRLFASTEAGALTDTLADGGGPAFVVGAAALAGAGAAFLFYRRFRLPFAVFLTGFGLFVATLALAGRLEAGRWLSAAAGGDYADLFDLSQTGPTALATLGFGLAAFAVAMAFDRRDPHRVSRLSACGFWLHVLAAPAIVNTVAGSLWRLPGALGATLLAATVLVIAVVALVIDRRAFLLAGVAWIALLLGAAFRGASAEVATTAILLILGVGITGLGAVWPQARGLILSALPDFPGKDRLPPWTRPEGRRA
jgi:hypothetical protein